MVQMCGRFCSTFPPFDLCCWLTVKVSLVDSDWRRRSDEERYFCCVSVCLQECSQPSFPECRRNHTAESFLASSSTPVPGSTVTPSPSVSCVQSRFCISDCSGCSELPFPACFNTLSFCCLLHLNQIVHLHKISFLLMSCPRLSPLSLQVHEPVVRNTDLMSPSATPNKGMQLNLPVSRRFNPAYKNKSLMDCCPEVFILLKFPPESALKFTSNGMEIIVSTSFKKPRVFCKGRQ